MKSESFVRKAIPYLKSDLFQERAEKLLFDEIQSYIVKYNMPPPKEALTVAFNNKTHISEADYTALTELVDSLDAINEVEPDWLIDETEKFCQERSLHNAILESIHIMDGQDKHKDKGMIPKLLSDALAVSFDPNIGHDFLEDAEARYDYYHHIEERIPFDLAKLNKITKGGLPKKTLNVILAGINVGKSLAMCHVGASTLAQNKNVLYITLEMAQERIAQRIDANLLNVSMDEIEALPKDQYDTKINRLKENIKGKLIIKEFPTASASAMHFKALLNELKLKKRFTPDLIIIDYINICASSRIKPGSNINSYSYIKAIAEELRGLAVEFDVPILTATQLTRDGFNNSDPDMTDVAESFGLPATADWMIVFVNTEELEAINQIMVKQIKSRYDDVTKNKRFIIGIDRAKQRLYDVDDKAQKSIQNPDSTPDKPVNEVTENMRAWMNELSPRKKFDADIKM